MRQSSPSALLRSAARNVERMLASHAQELSVTPNLLRVLLLLGEQPGLTAAEIGRELGFDRASRDYIVRKLARQRFIRRTVNPINAKKMCNVLTPRGEQAAGKARSIIAQVDKSLGKIMDIGSLSWREKLERIAGL